MSKLKELQSSYHTLVGISMELVSALESAIASKPVSQCVYTYTDIIMIVHQSDSLKP